MSKVTKLAEECGITSGKVEKFAAHLYQDGYRAKIRNDDIAALRDHFAGLAMQGLLAADKRRQLDEKGVCLIAYSQADAMLKEREKE